MNVAIESPAPDEHEQAVQAIATIKATYQDYVDLGRKHDLCALDLGKMLAQLFENDWCRKVAGMTTEQWVTTNLVATNGKRMTIDVANTLARDWRLISKFPKVEHLVRCGKETRTAAFYACATIDLMAGPGNDLAAMGLLASKSGKELRAEYYALKNDTTDKEQEWVPISGAVPAQVKQEMVDVLDEIKALEKDDGPPASARTLTWQIEHLAGFGRDALDAIRAHIAGNDGPLSALVETVRVSG